MSIWPPVILKGANVLINGITFPDSGLSLISKGDASELGTTSSTALKGSLSGRIGELLTVRLVEVLSPEKLLLEIAGSEVVAKGSAPPGTTGLFTVRLESLEPLVQFSLADQTESGLPLELRRLISEVVAKPNLFAQNITLLKELLLDETINLPASLRNSIKSLTTRFSAATLISELRSGEGLPLKQLGLFHEQELATLLLADPGKFPRTATREPLTVKENLLHLLAQLHGGTGDELHLESSGKNAQLMAGVRSGLRSLLDLVELNQCLNNPGLRSDEGLILLLPLWGWGETADLWLRLLRDKGEAKTPGANLYTLMIYLDLESLGPLGAQMVVGSRELQVKLMVVGDESARSVRELLPEARKQLRSQFPGGVRLTVETVGPNGVEEFRQRAFLASLPSLFTASG